MSKTLETISYILFTIAAVLLLARWGYVRVMELALVGVCFYVASFYFDEGVGDESTNDS